MRLEPRSPLRHVHLKLGCKILGHSLEEPNVFDTQETENHRIPLEAFPHGIWERSDSFAVRAWNVLFLARLLEGCSMPSIARVETCVYTHDTSTVFSGCKLISRSPSLRSDHKRRKRGPLKSHLCFLCAAPCQPRCTRNSIQSVRRIPQYSCTPIRSCSRVSDIPRTSCHMLSSPTCLRTCCLCQKFSALIRS